MADHGLFELAQYAHDAIWPLLVEAKAIEPSLMLHLELNFADENTVHFNEDNLNVFIHWNRPGLFLYATYLRTRTDIDHVTARLRADVNKLKANPNE